MKNNREHLDNQASNTRKVGVDSAYAKSAHTKFWSIACSIALVAGMNPAMAFATEGVTPAKPAETAPETALVVEQGTNVAVETPAPVEQATEEAAPVEAANAEAEDEGTSELEAADKNDDGTWDGSSSVRWTRGAGTAANPYIIESGANLNYLAQSVNKTGERYTGVYFALDRDIDMTHGDFDGIGVNSSSYFAGHFNGNFHSITVNMVGESRTENLGIFCYVSGTASQQASIENLIARGQINAVSTVRSYTGGVVGTMRYCDITRVRNEVNITYTGGSYYEQYMGGIAGTMLMGPTSIDQCSNYGSITGGTYGYGGGIVGLVSGSAEASVSNCYNEGAIATDYFAGGIIGSAQPCTYAAWAKNYYSCYNVGSVSAHFYGGLVGNYPVSNKAIPSANLLTDMYWLEDSSPWWHGDGLGLNDSYYTGTNVEIMSAAAMKTRVLTSALNNTDSGMWVSDSRRNPVNGGYPMLAWENPGSNDVIDLSECAISPIEKQTYTGSAITPSVSVTFQGDLLAEGIDYAVSYANNTNVGIATVTVTGINGVEGSASQTFEIAREAIAIPTANTTLIYNGSEQIGVAAGAGYTLSGATATGAGTYTATATLNDPAHFTWSDGTTDPKNITWTIAKQTMHLPTPVSNLTYIGEMRTGVYAGSGYTVTGGNAINAGDYIAICTLNDGANYMWAETGTASAGVPWSIKKINVAIPTAKTGLVYNGRSQSAFSTALTYTITTQSATAAGNYTATATLVDSTNYQWTDGTTAAKRISWSIAKATVTEPTASTGFVYDGIEKLSVAPTKYYTVSGGSSTEAGNHVATVTLSDPANYKWSSSTDSTLVLPWTIARATISAPTANKNLTYNGNEQVGVPAGAGYTLSGTATAKLPGDYTATATPDSNHAWSDGSTAAITYTWSIFGYTAFAPNAANGLVYNGSTQTGVYGGSGYTVTGTTSATEPGTYTATATPREGYTWNDGTDNPVTITWSIAKATVSAPVANETSTYDGQTHTGFTFDSSLITASNNSDARAGSYEAIFSLSQPSRYTWADGSSADLKMTWTINRAAVQNPAVLTNLTYNGTTQTGVFAGTGYSVSGNKAANAGSYTAVATLDGNHCWSDGSTANKTIGWSIAKATVTAPTANANLVWDGSIKTGVNSGSGYSLTNNTATSAGTYTAYATLNNATNFKWSTSNASTIAIGWTISRAPIAAPTAIGGLVFDGSEKTGVESGEGYTLSGTTKATAAGEYTATATLDANHRWNDGSTADKTITWTISGYTLAAPTAATGLVYNGREQTAVNSGEGYTVTGGSAKNAGTYTATATLNDPAHFTWNDGTTAPKSITWTIDRATLNLPTAATGLVYNGYTKTGVSAGQGYTVTNGSAKDAGTYTAICTVNDANNFMWAETSTSTAEITWSIARINVTAPTAKTGLVYTGRTQTALTGTMNYTVSGQSASAAGTYTAIATLKDSTNYQWTDGTTDPKNIPWSIAKATVTEPTASTGFVYDGNVKLGVAGSSKYTVVNGSTAEAGNHIATVTLNDPTNYTWTSTQDATISIPWSIARSAVAAPTATTGLTYNGTEQVGVPSATGYTVIDGSAINAGTYTATAVLDSNHIWNNGSDANATVEWTINRASIAIPAGSTMDYSGDVLRGVSLDDELLAKGAYSITGAYEASAAGMYECTITPTSNYQWTNGTTSPQIIGWEIVDNSIEYSFTMYRRSDNILPGQDQYFWTTHTGYVATGYQWQYSSDNGATWQEWTDDPSFAPYLTSCTQAHYRNYLMRLVMFTANGEEVASNTMDWGFGPATAVLTNLGLVKVNGYQTFTVTLYNLPLGTRPLLYRWYYTTNNGINWMPWSPSKYKTDTWKAQATRTFVRHQMKCEVYLSDGTILVSNPLGWNILT